MTEKRKISRDQYLQALGLFVLGNDHYTKGQEIETVLNAMLGLESGSHVSNVMFDERATAATNFDRALLLEDIEVERGLEIAP
jgi:hypothetical protein